MKLDCDRAFSTFSILLWPTACQVFKKFVNTNELFIIVLKDLLLLLCTCYCQNIVLW